MNPNESNYKMYICKYCDKEYSFTEFNKHLKRCKQTDR